MTGSRAAAALVCALAACGPQRSGGPALDHPPVSEVPALELRCGRSSPVAFGLCVEPSRIQRDVERVARPRPPGSAHHRWVRELCASRLRGLGFDVELQHYGSGTNVIGTLPGITKSGEQVILSAHYDQRDGCPGADDNASGVAALLEAARVLAGGRFERSLVAACWDESERGSLGSQAYARRARARGESIVAAVVLESIAFAVEAPDSQSVPEEFERHFPDQALWLLDREYRGDFLLLVADEPSSDAAAILHRHAELAGQPAVLLHLTKRQKREPEGLHRRDQASFWDEWQRAVLLTDSGPFRNRNAGCANGSDTPDGLDFGFASRVTRATVAAAAELLSIRYR